MRPVLRDAEPPSIDETGVYVVSGIGEVTGHLSDGRQVVAEGHVRDVLHQRRRRLDFSDNCDKRSPKLGSCVGRIAMSFADQ